MMAAPSPVVLVFITNICTALSIQNCTLAPSIRTRILLESIVIYAILFYKVSVLDGLE